MSDGAHGGISADRALETILGGKPSPEKTGEHVMSAGEMKDWLLSADPANRMASYGEFARFLARMMLEAFLANPALASDDDALTQVVDPGFYSEATWFQWGWAVNAARRCVELAPAPNPAIVTIHP